MEITCQEYPYAELMLFRADLAWSNGVMECDVPNPCSKYTTGSWWGKSEGINLVNTEV